MFWDEDNRLMVLSDNGKTSRYTYNAGGERIIKSHGSMEGVYINGAPQGITFHETDEFTLYPASIITVNRHRFTKHYFIGDKRVASRLGLGEFRNVYGSNGSNVTAGQQDYAERMNQIEQKREEYYKLAGVAPGLPTMKGSYADPEVTGRGYNELITEIGDHRVPENWVQHPVVNTEAGSNPGAPLAWGSPENPDDAVAGYGYVPCDTSEVEETFYYHSDHLGSTAYITDQKANVTQYDAYLPYGELLVDEHSSSTEMPYKFNGKELDEETGLYYYGARYMNPVTSMWYGVDPLTEQYVNIGAYIYCHSNPIVLIDPDGQGDYYKQDGTWVKTDKRDDNLAYVENNKGSYVLLPYTNDVLLGFASLINKESSGNIDESMAIGSAVMNFLSRGGSKQLKTLEDVAMYENHYSYGAKKEVYQNFCKLSHTKQNAKGGIRSAINAICFYENVEGVESKNYAVFNGVKADCWDGMDLVLKNGNPHTRKYIWSADSKRIIEKYISKVEGSNHNLKFKYSNKGSQRASSSAIGIVGFTVFQKLLSGHGEGKKTDKKTGRLLPVAE